ncbi:MAG: hypothetical protein H0T96_06855 [Thermoleophilaceae bacterium]|nr:hypothetical protein [Thermoleophilaceae bacterium]
MVPGAAKRLFRARLIARSRNAGGRTEAVTLRNSSQRSRSVYVVTYVHAGSNSLDAAYDLTIRRSR